jgi:hypothetical protein
MLDIIDGRKFAHLNVTKDMRKQIKFAIKRGEKLDEIKRKIFLVNIKDLTEKTKHMVMVKL